MSDGRLLVLVGVGAIAAAGVARRGRGSRAGSSRSVGAPRSDRQPVADVPYYLELWKCSDGHISTAGGPCGWCGIRTLEAFGFYYDFYETGYRRSQEKFGPFETAAAAEQDGKVRCREHHRTRYLPGGQR